MLNMSMMNSYCSTVSPKSDDFHEYGLSSHYLVLFFVFVFVQSCMMVILLYNEFPFPSLVRREENDAMV